MSPHDLYRQGLLELLAETMKEYPQASEKTHHDKLWDKIREIDSYYLTLFDNWFASNYTYMEVIDQGPNNVAVRRKVRRINTARKAVAKTRAKELLSNFVLMNQVLSTGRLLRDSTFFDCKREGGWYTALSKKGRALEIVGKKLEEKDVQNIHARYFKQQVNAA